MELFDHAHDERRHQTARNVRKLLDVREVLGRTAAAGLRPQHAGGAPGPDPREWITSLMRRSGDYDRGRALFDHLWHDVIDAAPDRASNPLRR